MLIKQENQYKLLYYLFESGQIVFNHLCCVFSWYFDTTAPRAQALALPRKKVTSLSLSISTIC